MRARLHQGSAAGDGRIRSLLLSDAAKAELVPDRIAIYYPDDRVYWRQALSTMIKEVHDALVEAGASNQKEYRLRDITRDIMIFPYRTSCNRALARVNSV